MSERPSWSRIAKSARDWWRELQPSDEFGQPRAGDRAALARLRRAATPSDAMVEEATLALFRGLGLRSEDYRWLPRVAVIAMALAHIREDLIVDDNRSPLHPGRRVGRKSDRPEDIDKALMKPLRFRRLLAACDDDELAREMRRVVALADGKINVGDLAASLFFWGDKVRWRWAFEYYAAGDAAPRDNEAAPASEPTVV
jgi:CRISPR system Cascade subunit CasB